MSRFVGIVLLLAVVCGVAFPSAGEELQAKRSRAGVALATEKAAVDRTALIMGLSPTETHDLSRHVGSVERVSMKGHTLPFLTAELQKKRAWKVTLTDVMVRIKDEQGVFRDSIARDFDVYVDSATGSVLRIVSLLPGKNYDSLTKDIDVGLAEENLTRWFEKYKSYCDSLPPVSFLEALPELFWYPFSSSMIDGTCVMLSYMKRPAQPAWIIECHDVHLLSTRGGVGTARIVVDAVTGKRLYTSGSIH